MKISHFFLNQFKDFSLYSSFRGIANFVDGLKPSTRKLIFTVDKRNITQNMKVANLASSAAELTSYLHGAVSLEGATVGLAQDFCNNCNLLDPEGNFGNSLAHNASASRYIFTKKSKWFDLILNPDDRNIINYRFFEGDSIEPFFYVPIVPLILVNGSSGIGSGYAQKILPRKLEFVIDALEKLLNDKKVKNITPSLNSFNGNVIILGDNRVEIVGKFEKGDAKLTITDLPFSYERDAYIKELENLVEKDLIKSYKDLSEHGIYRFDIKCTREFCSLPDEEILSTLKLVDKQTENFSCISEKDTIVVFKNEIELMKAFIKIRLKYYDLRKKYLIKNLTEKSIELKNKIRFLKEIMSDKLIVYKKSKSDIEKLLVAGKYEKVYDSYDFLLAMRIDSFTTEKYKKLEEDLVKSKEELEVLTLKTEKDLWIEDLKLLKKANNN